MKILITYFSQTGNTEKIAEAIHEITSKNHDSYLKKVKKVKIEDLANYDLIFIGSACHDSDLAKPVLRFLKKIPKSPKYAIAGFYTHSTFLPEGDNRIKELSKRWSGKCSETFEKFKEEKNVTFKGYFRCQGIPSPPIEQFIHKTIIKEDDEWADFLEEVKKHPDGNDIENAKKFAQDILNEF
ncbi:MAG: flavodoxin family protein [Promethearchaeota archaeon]|jgi:flavodoxin